jgi:dihydroxyacetone kinase
MRGPRLLPFLSTGPCHSRIPRIIQPLSIRLITDAPSKKIINSPANAVRESLLGLVALNPNLYLLPTHNVVVRKDVALSNEAKNAQVHLISGGGSGHEPSHAGWIGKGMLSAAVCGDVFASPSASAVLEGLNAVSGDKGTLVIVKNYTGDRLNFGRAAKRAEAEGGKVKMVVIGDDCGIPKTERFAGRRGLVGTVLVEKIAGWAAASGKSLDKVTELAQLVADNCGTVGFSLTTCSIPGKSPAFHLEAGEIELALGIHGESGVKSLKMTTSAELVKICVDMILSTDPDRNYLPFDIPNGDRTVLVVNNLGGTTNLELGIAVNDTISYLTSLNLAPTRTYAGTFMTSLEMAGIQICLLRVPRGEKGEEMLAALDAETDAMAWPRFHDPAEFKDLIPMVPTPEQPVISATHPHATHHIAHSIAHSIAKTLLEAEPELTRLDQLVGDGDAGLTIASGATAVLRALETGHISTHTLSSFAKDLSEVLEHHMGGSFGAVLCIFLDSFAGYLRPGLSGTLEIAQAVEIGMRAVCEIGGAKPGDRTMVDALEPFARVLKETGELGKAVEAARKGAEGTGGMKKARMGRSSYLVGKELDVPDPGAWAVLLAVEAVEKVLGKESD